MFHASFCKVCFARFILIPFSEWQDISKTLGAKTGLYGFSHPMTLTLNVLGRVFIEAWVLFTRVAFFRVLLWELCFFFRIYIWADVVTDWLVKEKECIHSQLPASTMVSEPERNGLFVWVIFDSLLINVFLKELYMNAEWSKRLSLAQLSMQ